MALHVGHTIRVRVRVELGFVYFEDKSIALIGCAFKGEFVLQMCVLDRFVQAWHKDKRLMLGLGLSQGCFSSTQGVLLCLAAIEEEFGLYMGVLDGFGYA